MMDGSNQNELHRALDAVRTLVPVISQHRAEFDRERRLPVAVWEAMIAADLFRLWVPRVLGGAEVSARALVDITEEAAALDASVGWILANGAILSRGAGLLPESVAREWWSQPDCFVAGSTASVGSLTPVEGGYRVSGRWPFTSGVQAARRVMGLCRLEGGSEDPRENLFCVYMPAEAIRSTDNWHVSGLRGTGSCDFEAGDLFVPEDQIHRFLEPQPTQPGLLYQAPTISLFSFSVGLVPLGIARAAVQSFVGLAGRTRGGTTQPLREREMIQVDVARAEALRRSAKALVIDALAELEAAMSDGGYRLLEARAFFRVALTHAAETCHKAVGMIAAAAGTTAISEASPLERLVRDMDAAAKHVAVGPHTFVAGGRVLLGLDPGTGRL